MIENLDIIVSDNNIKIKDSFKVSKKDFKTILNELRYKYTSNNVLLNRKNCSMKLEWATHNFLYLIGYKRERTKDVDLNYPQKWYINIAYSVLGFFSLLFIK